MFKNRLQRYKEGMADSQENKVYLSLGSNLGDRHSILKHAIVEISTKIGRNIVVSGFYETEAWGFETKKKFLNCAVSLVTQLKPHEVLDKCLDLEIEMGRDRSEPKTKGNYADRAIDIDLIDYAEIILDDSRLILPHPLMHQRLFVLIPLNEINSKYFHPVFKLSINQLIKDCSDNSALKRVMESK